MGKTFKQRLETYSDSKKSNLILAADFKNIDSSDYFGEYKLFAAEMPLYERMKGEDYRFKGFIDAIVVTPDKKVHIFDWKTCGWGWDAFWRCYCHTYEAGVSPGPDGISEPLNEWCRYFH